MKKVLFIAVAAMFFASCGGDGKDGGTVKDKAQEWCDCVKENARDSEDCVKMMKAHVEGMNKDEQKEYYNAQEECLK